MVCRNNCDTLSHSSLPIHWAWPSVAGSPVSRDLRLESNRGGLFLASTRPDPSLLNHLYATPSMGDAHTEQLWLVLSLGRRLPPCSDPEAVKEKNGFPSSLSKERGPANLAMFLYKLLVVGNLEGEELRRGPACTVGAEHVQQRREAATSFRHISMRSSLESPGLGFVLSVNLTIVPAELAGVT